MITYDKTKHEKLKYKFFGSENIEKNYSQAYQDIFVLTMLNGKRNGTFLEIGGCDGSFISNTCLLEKNFDWKGVSIDIDPSAQNRFNERKKTNFILQDALTINYENLLKDNNFDNIVDYLQIDIEPQHQTLKCLKLIPFSKYKFSVITFETDFYDPATPKEESIKNRDESREYLKSMGYELIVGNVCNTSENDPFEDWYVHPSIISQEIISLFKTNSEFNKPSEYFFLNL